MKMFKKIEFNSCKLSNEEMKNIQGKFYGGYACNVSTSGNSYSCSSATSNCMKANGSLGNCTITISSPYSRSCACE